MTLIIRNFVNGDNDKNQEFSKHQCGWNFGITIAVAAVNIIVLITYFNKSFDFI